MFGFPLREYLRKIKKIYRVTDFRWRHEVAFDRSRHVISIEWVFKFDERVGGPPREKEELRNGKTRFHVPGAVLRSVPTSVRIVIFYYARFLFDDFGPRACASHCRTQKDVY